MFVLNLGSDLTALDSRGVAILDRLQNPPFLFWSALGATRGGEGGGRGGEGVSVFQTIGAFTKKKGVP